MRISLFLAAVFAVALAAPSASAQDTPPTDEAAPAADGETLVAVLEADGRFSTLVGALQATNLVETLSGDGPFTVFAPTDEAFAALTEGTVEALTPEQLQGILLYHVVGGAVDSGTAATAGEAPTAWGDQALTFAATEDGGLTVNGVSVSEADVAASNGVIHIVDGVLMPPASDTPEGDTTDGSGM